MNTNEDLGKQLSRKHTERFSQLRHFYPDADARTLIELIDYHGINRWESISIRVQAITHRSYQEQEYDDSLYEEFVVDKNYMFNDLILIVTRVRSELRLPIYTNQIRKQCEQEFQRLFITERITQDNPNGTGKICIGYKAVFNLKPEDR